MSKKTKAVFCKKGGGPPKVSCPHVPVLCLRSSKIHKKVCKQIKHSEKYISVSQRRKICLSCYDSDCI